MAHTSEALTDLDWYPLSNEDIQHFDDKGYLIIRNVLDSETVDKLIEVSDRLIASDLREKRQTYPNGLYDGFRNCVATDDAFIPLLAHKTMLSVVTQLLGAHLQLVVSHLDIQIPRSTGHTRYRSRPGLAS